VLDCLELVEVNPIRDHENTTAALAVGLAASALVFGCSADVFV
jgi:arginase family enzyme